MYGCFGTGTIYLGIGVIAILSYMRLKDGGADEKSLLAFLNEYILGEILVWFILLGAVSYILWRIFEAIKDPYGYGSDKKGLVHRIGIGLSSIADALIGYSAIEVLSGAGPIATYGQPTEYRDMVGDILDQNAGQMVIVLAGFIILTTAILQFIYGVTRGYKERLNIAQLNTTLKNTIHLLAWVGYLSRGVILGITGFFLVKAGFVNQARFAVNTDKAFDFIGDNIGGVAFILAAAGTICYGLFMFLLGATYNADLDNSSSLS